MGGLRSCRSRASAPRDGEPFKQENRHPPHESPHDLRVVTVLLDPREKYGCRLHPL